MPVTHMTKLTLFLSALVNADLREASVEGAGGGGGGSARPYHNTFYADTEWQAVVGAPSGLNALYADVPDARTDPEHRGCRRIQSPLVQNNSYGIPADMYLLAINTSGEVGRIGALTNTTASEKEWLILTSMSDFSCFPGLTGNTSGDYNRSHSWSPTATVNTISKGMMTKYECMQECRNTPRCLAIDTAANSTTVWPHDNSAQMEECNVFTGSAPRVHNASTNDVAHCTYDPDSPEKTQFALNNEEYLDNLHADFKLVSRPAAVCGDLCYQDPLCEVAVFNDERGLCYGYVGYDVLVSPWLTSHDHLRELGSENFTLLDCAIDMKKFCPRTMNTVSSEAALTTWPRNVVCPIRAIGSQCDPCKIGHSQIPFDVLFNKFIGKPSMYCEDISISMSVQHADQDETERIACFASLPYENWPTCAGAANQFNEEESVWWFAGSAGVNTPMSCPESTRVYQDILDDLWVEFNSNGSSMDWQTFRKDYTDFVRGHHSEFYWGLGGKTVQAGPGRP